MRCRGCHYGLLPSDTHCPACGQATQFGKMGGALVWDSTTVRVLKSRRRFFTTKRVRSLIFFVVGLIAMVGGGAIYLDARSHVPTARSVTVDELLQIDRPEALPGWIAYTPPRALDPGIEFARLRSFQTTSKFLLLQAGDHWLLTEVTGNFHGARLEGKLGPFDRLALQKVVTAYPNEAERLLPYQFQAELDIMGTLRQSFLYSSMVAFFGSLLAYIGLRDFCAKSSLSRGPALAASGLLALQGGQARPQNRSGTRWALGSVAWAGVFLLVAVLVIVSLAKPGAVSDPEVRKQLVQETMQKQGPWLLLGPLLLATVLGWLGWLPGTRR